VAISASETSTSILRGRPRTDAELARAAGRGHVEAFEALYERHHRGLLSFSRHMLGRVHDAEDVVQHTFLAADAAFRKGRVPSSVRPWLYTVARNRCISLIRARRDDRALPDPGVPSTENLVQDVEQREELRELLADLRTLPDDQRAALLLAELGELSHAEVAQVIGVRTHKVKALVFQARTALMAAADARAIPCRSIREELAVATGAGRRRRHLRDHLARCEGCRAYADRVAAQRASVAAILPVVPTVALREGVLAGLGTGSAGAAAGGAGAGLGLLAAKSTAAKALAVVAIGGAAAGGGTVAVTVHDQPPRERAARPAPAKVAPAAEVEIASRLAAPESAPQRAAAVPGDARPGAGSRRGAERRRADERTVSRPAKRAGKRRPAAAGNGPRGKPETPPGRALGRAKQQERSKPPQAKPPAAKPAGEKPSPPARSNAPAAPRTAAAPAEVREPGAAAGGQAPRRAPAPAGRPRSDRTEKPQPPRSSEQAAPSE
jgi:RNA polymerase sigma factor (sigma-70 family)